MISIAKLLTLLADHAQNAPNQQLARILMRG
jgi:hypothetical protein